MKRKETDPLQQQEDKQVKKISTEPQKISTKKSNKESCAIIDKALAQTYAPLHLDETNVKAKIGPTKTRNHVNPLQIYLQKPHEKIDWSSVYDNPELPLAVDIGCAAGRFSLLMAKHEKYKNYNHLGYEIRQKLVIRANAWAQEIGLRNVHYISASANFSLKPVLEDYPGRVELIAIQYPDPHFKKKHHKRRVLQQDLVNDIADVLAVKGRLFLQSDVEEISAEMRDRATLCSRLKRVGDYTPRDNTLVAADCAKGGIKEFWTSDGKRGKGEGQDYGDWMIGDNPLGCPTEREVANLAVGNSVFRSLFEKVE